MEKKQLKVAVIGGGLVGSLSALFFAQKGHEVHLYEYREDIRLVSQAKGRSINLSMSSRARAALKMVGLEDKMLEHGIPMSSRMIHGSGGALRPIPYDKKGHQSIYSVGRKFLNETLLEAAELLPNVHLRFNHKLVTANLEKGQMTFQLPKEGDTLVHEVADLIVGADGAFSAVRRQMMKLPMFDFSQTYIEHGYLELCIPPTESGEFAMKKNYLHIWPRGTFMMIALPNQDKSWTVTLFMPFKDFLTLDTPEKLVEFFQKHFPDSIPLIGKNRLITDFFGTKPSPLVSIKCRPYHVGDKAIIIGDAAHAMVPFYGQGMNAGFEDVLLLDQLMTQHDDNLAIALRKFSATRNKDAEAICDLAFYNYIEMRDLVTRRSFLVRKKLDDFLFWLLPNVWVPLYCSVTFTDMRYHKCIDNKKWQDKVLHRFGLAAGVVSSVGLSAALYFYHTSFLGEPINFMWHKLYSIE